MAFDTARLQMMCGGGGVAGTSWYEYITNGTDTVANCVAPGYFNNDDDFVKFRVGDRINIIVPGTQSVLTNAELKQIVDVGATYVALVVASTGIVHCTADVEGTTVSYT